METLNEKAARLRGILRDCKSAAVAFSGGADSALLLALTREALGENCAAVTVLSAFFPEREDREAAELARALGVPQIVLAVDVLSVPGVRENPPERCYLCKRALFARICVEAAARGFACVLEGGNADDMRARRPGARAVRELGVRSPLAEAGLTKAEVRELSRQLGLPTAEKPAMACLATRFPTGDPITPEGLSRAAAAEDALAALGLTQRRVRVHGDLARIEVLPEEAQLVTAHAAQVDRELRALGFRWVSLDLGGYKTGNMD